jgi:hypothetical protein
VVTALELGVSAFLFFDADQRKLAAQSREPTTDCPDPRWIKTKAEDHRLIPISWLGF